jgi:hypothetical protein
MRRSIAMVVFVSTMLAGLALPAQARGVSDPDDVDGRLDIRSVDVSEAGTDAAVLTLTFYADYRPQAIPDVDCRHCRNRGLGVSLDRYTQGVFFRKNGRTKFSYGDHGSTCCAIYRVSQPDPDTLVVRYELNGDEGNPGHRVYASSSFRHETDTTRRFHIPAW